MNTTQRTGQFEQISSPFILYLPPMIDFSSESLRKFTFVYDIDKKSDCKFQNYLLGLILAPSLLGVGICRSASVPGEITPQGIWSVLFPFSRVSIAEHL